MDRKGFSIIELLVTIAIIGILAGIAVPAYIGQQKRASRNEAYANLQNLRLLEESYYAENGTYTASTGTCAKDTDNLTAIQALMPGFKPGTGLFFSYCTELNIKLDGTAQTPCVRARAFGNGGTRVDGDEFRIDCNNDRNF